MEASVDTFPIAGLCDLTPGYPGEDHPHKQSLADSTHRKVNGEVLRKT